MVKNAHVLFELSQSMEELKKKPVVCGELKSSTGKGESVWSECLEMGIESCHI